MIYRRMPGNCVKIKFSPFEALFIGEKNKIVKRQPIRNTIFVTKLSKARKAINLRELFDLNDGPRPARKIQIVTKFKNRKTEKRKDVYCYEYEGRKLIVKGNEFVEFKLKTEKNENKKKCVKFRPDFKFKETLEEKIVNKFQNRRKNDLEKNKVEDNKRLLIRGPDGKFLSPNHKLKNLSIYLERLCEKKIAESIKRNCDDECKVVKEIIRSPLSGRVAKKFCENYSPPEIKLPPYPKNVKPSDYDDDDYLIDILYEHHTKMKKLLKEEPGIIEIDRPKDLKVYGKKKSTSTDIEVVYDSRLEIEERVRNRIRSEEFRTRRRVPNYENGRRFVQNAIRTRRKNGFNSRIDEPLNIDDHLIEGNNLGTLVFNTSTGDNLFLGNIVRPFLFDSPFGSLPSV